MNRKNKITDFGEKIGGARKDLWKERGFLIADDMLSMNDAERQKYIKKDLIWKKPDYMSLVHKEGIPVRVVYFMKTIRDATPTKPIITYLDKTSEQIQKKQEGYIEFVGKLRDAVMALRSEIDVLTFYNDFIKANYVIPTQHRYRIEVSEKAYGCLNDNKILRESQIKDFRSLDRKINRTEFCFTEKQKEEKAKKLFLNKFIIIKFDKKNITFEKDYQNRTQMKVIYTHGISYLYPEGEEANPNSYKEGKYIILQNGKIFAKNIDSIDDANSLLEETFQQTYDKYKININENTSAKKRKTNFIPQQLKHIKRVGEEYRFGRNVKGDDYLELFAFRGGEFGNWMSENDRKASLNFGYDALLDLSKALEIDPQDISLGNRLSIAFGSRGHSGAAAHYEPMREVINLTKMHGAGSLAHEWGHALDDILGKSLGLDGFMSEKTYKKDTLMSLKNLIDTMRYKESSGPEIIEKQKKEAEKQSNNLKQWVLNEFPLKKMSDIQKDKLNNMIATLIEKAPQSQDTLFTYVSNGFGNTEIDALSEYKKEITGHVISKETRINFAHWQNSVGSYIKRIGTPERIKTDFFENSILFDKQYSKSDKGYWQSEIEMFARAFACYVKDKIEGRSDYLCGHADAAISFITNNKGETETIKAYPVGEEREIIYRCFDEFIQELKDMNLLHHYDFSVKQQNQEGKGVLEDLVKNAEELKLTSEKTKSGDEQLTFIFEL